jgi:integrase/recombinase XerC
VTDLPVPQNPQLPTLSKLTHRELIEAFLARRSPNTMDAYKRDLRSFKEWLGADSVEDAAKALLTADHGRANMAALRWKQHLVEEGLAPSTINRRLAALRSMVELANRLGMVPWTLSVDNVPVTKHRDASAPGAEGFKALLVKLDERDDTLKTRRDRAMIHLLFGLALRRFEVVALSMSDVEFGRNRLKIVGKGRSQAEYISMSPSVSRALADWIELRGSDPGALFVSMDPAGKGNGRLTGKSLHRIVRSLGHACNLNVWPHGLRHAAITAALDATDGDVRKVQRFSRHKKVETVLTYDDNRQDLGGQVADLLSDKLGEDTDAA